MQDPGEVSEVVEHGRLEQVGVLGDTEVLRTGLQEETDVLEAKELGQLRSLVDEPGKGNYLAFLDCNSWP